MTRLVMFLVTVGVALGGSIVAAQDSKAAGVLAQARAALGDERRVGRIQGLSCAGTVQRMIGDRQLSGELTIDLQLPDKLLRRDSIRQFGDAVMVTEQGIDGERVLRGARVLNAPAGGLIRMPPPPAAGSDAEAEARRISRAELTRLTIALLLTPPASMPVELSYVGEAEAPDGKADVLDVKGPSGFAARLFLDKSTRRPLMLMYRGIAPQMVVQRRGGPPPATADARVAPPNQQLADITLFFDDYQAVGGVLFPHHLTQAIDGTPTEEWTFKTITINPAFKPDTFSVNLARLNLCAARLQTSLSVCCSRWRGRACARPTDRDSSRHGRRPHRRGDRRRAGDRHGHVAGFSGGFHSRRRSLAAKAENHRPAD